VGGRHPVNIVHVCLSVLPGVYTRHGGAVQRLIGELAAAQARQGHRVTVYSPWERSESTMRDGVDVRYLGVRDTSLTSRLSFLARATRSIRHDESSASVVHFHGEPEAGMLGPRRRSVQVLSYTFFRFRGISHPSLRSAYRRVFDAFDALCPCSRYCAEESSAWWSLPAERLSVLYAGVNTAQFAPEASRGLQERQRLEIDGEMLLYVGRVTEQKGTDVLLEALPRIRAERPSVELVVAGPIEQFAPGNREQSRRRWERRFADAGVRYLGPVEEERLVGLYNAADVFVMPTRELEMFGMAAVEAQACGTPVVASDHGGLRETVPAEAGGRFPVGDAGALAGTALRLLRDDGERAVCGENARRHAAQYSWDRIASDAAEIYDACLERRASDNGRRVGPRS
jgi:glycosyltransferase involved in cell wall biosynthesis